MGDERPIAESEREHLVCASAGVSDGDGFGLYAGIVCAVLMADGFLLMIRFLNGNGATRGTSLASCSLTAGMLHAKACACAA